jgi:hypothetical protein
MTLHTVYSSRYKLDLGGHIWPTAIEVLVVPSGSPAAVGRMAAGV